MTLIDVSLNETHLHLNASAFMYLLRTFSGIFNAH